MSYKYNIMKSLADSIRKGKIDPELDIKTVIEFYINNHNKPQAKQHKPWSNKPRFYNRAMSSNTRSRKLGDGSLLTASDFETVYSRDGGTCNKCGTDSHIVFDHIVSYYKGGRNTVDNLQLLCRICNMEKGVS